MNSKALRRSKRDALGEQALELDALDLRAVLLPLSDALCVLVALQLALDALAGPVEEVDHRPEQVFEIRLEPRVAKHLEQGVEDCGQRRLNNRLFRERPWIGFVLEGPVAVDLHFVNEAVGRGGGMVGLEGVVDGKCQVHDSLRRLRRRLSRPDGEPRSREDGPEPRREALRPSAAPGGRRKVS
ncbi:hypothetical protein FHS25_005966 [Rhizobium laguerreae]|uniref:Uncharacterized protein n=1 Tax=Rhizobium laguerreae TaxID=1076926 RepID=A0ABR6GGP9_9HYPH|nr:hypothetical protein [Rhizobium laguerreae]